MTLHEPRPHEWNECIDPVLLHRLLRPIKRPGVLSSSIAKRIVAWVDYFSTRLPLLEELSKKRGQGGRLRVRELPLVHARWVVETAPKVPTTSEKVPTTLERSASVQFSDARGTPNSPASRAQTAGSPPLAPENLDEDLNSHSAKVPTTFGNASAQPAKVPTTLGNASAQPAKVPTTLGNASAQPAKVPATLGNASAQPAKVPATLGNASAQPAKASATFGDVSAASAKASITFEDMSAASAKAAITFEDVSAASAKASISLADPSAVGAITFPTPTIRPNVAAITTSSLQHVSALTVTPRRSTFEAPAPLIRVAPRTSSTMTPPAELPHASRSSNRSRPIASISSEPAMERVVRAAPASVITSENISSPPRAAPVQPAPKPDVDVDTLVDKVERKLLRRMAAERDRRGGFG